MTDYRPNPDELLNQIQQEAITTERGKLKIFFGSSAGVGKTYDMLMAAHQAQNQGLKVLVGIVETHGRSETAALLDGLNLLPLKTVLYRGQTLKEFDLDTALALHPDILLVDELAHSNVPGSRHPKRWQDVEELINAGINVYTTLNVQHLESVNDVVNQITGIAVRETLPDWFFDAANEVVLVDLPADELLTRLDEGKVYLPNQAKNAVKNFFRKGNLIALRELALRRTAERVDADMRHYRKQARISPIWNTNDQLLVGLSHTSNNERLIRHAARLAGSLHTKWYVAYVETPHHSVKYKQSILDALRLAEEMGATTQIITAGSVAEGLTSYAHQFNIGRIVIGQQPTFGWWRTSLVEQIARQDTKLDLILVNLDHSSQNNSSTSKPTTSPSVAFDWQTLWADDNKRGYLVAVVGCALVTASLFKLTQWLDLANVLMLYLLAIVFVSVQFGRLPGIFAVIISVLSFDFFFVNPKFSFSVSDVQYLLTFAILIIVSLLINNLAVGLRFQAQSARRREQQARSISELSQGLSASRKIEQLAVHATNWLLQHMADNALLITPSSQNRLQLTGDAVVPSEFDWVVAQWVFDHNQSAGLATHTLTANKMQYRPITASGQVQGVLAILPKDLAYFNQPEQQRFLDVAVAQIALTLERIYFAKVAQEAVIRVESEQLRGTLLSALSHDIRTPLAVLSTLAESLLHANHTTAEQQQLAFDIQQQSNAIGRLVVNILDYASLQSGGISVNKQWISLEELVGGVLQQLEYALGTRKVHVHIPEAWQFVYTDELLLARVLSNLLTNAINYSPKGSAIHIDATTAAANRFQINVIDNGDGVPIEMQERIFERFTRGNAESTVTGLGLGLALSRELVKSLDGTLSVRNVPPQGACFSIELPCPSQYQQQQFEQQLQLQLNTPLIPDNLPTLTPP